MVYMGKKFIISATGMPDDECKILEEELNKDITSKAYWVVSKPIDIVVADDY